MPNYNLEQVDSVMWKASFKHATFYGTYDDCVRWLINKGVAM